MSAPQRFLCDACSTLDLSLDVFTSVQPAGYGERVVELGPAWEVARRAAHCALCKLVAFAIASTNRDPGGALMGRKKLSVPDDQVIHLAHEPPRSLRIQEVGMFGTSRIRYVNAFPETTANIGQDARLLAPGCVDLRLINRWQRACERHHTGACKTTPAYNGRELTSLRYVDVVKNCIVDAPLDSSYIALSYVWGKVRTLKLEKDNVRQLYQPYSLEDKWHRIPKTIKDAIELTRDLHQRYLWVDTLCLIQDDERDVAAGLMMMDVVYEQAELTIIAASGPDAESGLPGYTPTEHRTQAIEKINNVSLAVTRELSYYMGYSDYNERGWTFQEQYLSRKKLIFVDNKVYWNCPQANWGEETPDEYHTWHDNFDLSTSLLSLSFGDYGAELAAWEVLDTCIKYYSLRHLSFEKDAINAISGLLDRIAARMCCRFIHGMPTATFDLALVFQKRTDVTLKRRKRFPSWCWAGWKGAVHGWELYGDHKADDTDVHISRWVNDSTWIIWYKRSPSGYLSPVWDPAANELFKSHSSTPGYRTRKPFVPPAGLQISCSRTTPTDKGAEMRAQPHPYHLLQFWTVTAVFKCRTYEILDKIDRRCGTITWDGFPAEQAPAKVKLAVLSEPIPTNYEKDGLDAPYLEDKMYWIMALFPVNGGYVERRGLGSISASALRWTDEPVQWEEIILG